MTPWLSLPESERKRLIRNEAAQRRETAKRGLPALPISVEGLWLISRGMCTCNECRGLVPLDPATAVIAHVFYRAGKGSPGHVPANVSLWNDACNRREAGLETSALGRGRRHTPKRPSDEGAEPACDGGTDHPLSHRDPALSSKRRKIQGGGFQKRTGPSPLSSKSKTYQRAKAMKRKP